MHTFIDNHRESAIKNTNSDNSTENSKIHPSQFKSPREDRMQSEQYDKLVNHHFALYENAVNEEAEKKQQEEIENLELSFNCYKKSLDSMIESEKDTSIKEGLQKIKNSGYSIDEMKNFIENIKNHKNLHTVKPRSIIRIVDTMLNNRMSAIKYENHLYKETDLERKKEKNKLDENNKKLFVEKFREMGTNLSFLFPGFPAEESWRLLMDGDRQEHGALYFDKVEPGYMAALMDAFCFMLENLGRKMEESLYYELHRRAINGVVSERDLGESMIEGYIKNGMTSDLSRIDVSSLELRFKACIGKENISLDQVVCNDDMCNPAELVGFRINKVNASLKGVSEYENKRNSEFASERMIYENTGFEHPDPIKNLESPKYIKTMYCSIRRTPEYYKKVINTVFDDYYSQINDLKYECDILNELHAPIDKSEYDRKILEIIVRTCQNLDQLHAFFDGNIRTVAFLVLNKMLIENGMSPTIMRDPNVFDMKSIDEIIQEVVAGQKAFESYKKEIST